MGGISERLLDFSYCSAWAGIFPVVIIIIIIVNQVTFAIAGVSINARDDKLLRCCQVNGLRGRGHMGEIHVRFKGGLVERLVTADVALVACNGLGRRVILSKEC